MGSDDRPNGVRALVGGLGGLPLIVISVMLLFPCLVAAFVIWRVDARLEDLVEAQRVASDAQSRNVGVLGEILEIQRRALVVNEARDAREHGR